MDKKVRRQYFLIVIDTGEEIEMTKKGYEMLMDDFATNRVGTQVVFKDKNGNQYMEQRSNVRLRESKEVVY